MPPNPRLASSGNRSSTVSNNDSISESKSGQEKGSGILVEKDQGYIDKSSITQNNFRHVGQQRSPYNGGQYGMNSGAYGMSGYGNSMGGLGGYGMMGMGGYGMGYGMSGYGMPSGGGMMGIVSALYSVNHILMSFGQLVQIIGGNSQQIMMQISNIRQFIIDVIKALRNPALEIWIKSNFRRYKLLRWLLVFASMAITAQITRLIRIYFSSNNNNVVPSIKSFFSTLFENNHQNYGKISDGQYLKNIGNSMPINSSVDDVMNTGIEGELSWDL